MGGWGVQECRREAGDAAALPLRRGPLAHGSRQLTAQLQIMHVLPVYFSVYPCFPYVLWLFRDRVLFWWRTARRARRDVTDR